MIKIYKNLKFQWCTTHKLEMIWKWVYTIFIILSQRLCWYVFDVWWTLNKKETLGHKWCWLWYKKWDTNGSDFEWRINPHFKEWTQTYFTYLERARRVLSNDVRIFDEWWIFIELWRKLWIMIMMKFTKKLWISLLNYTKTRNDVVGSLHEIDNLDSKIVLVCVGCLFNSWKKLNTRAKFNMTNWKWHLNVSEFKWKIN